MKTAVVLFNLGGPDNTDAIEPFLFNLFHDPAIISVPQPLRWLLAKLISKRRAPVAKGIYAEIGGGSPLLALTRQQAEALEGACSDLGEVKTFVCMRYWHPMSVEVVEAVKAFAPEKIVLLPLYPQFSTTTTGSSFKDWHRTAKKLGLKAPTVEVCCYPEADGWIEAQAALISESLKSASSGAKPRVLFSAHGLPEKVIAGGDPYQWQVEQTAKAVVGKLDIDDLDWVVCYQSRVGPMQWIGPSTDDEIKRAGSDGVPVIVLPIAFVSEHSETLVELDIEYRELAHENGVPGYTRVPAVGTQTAFIRTLAGLVGRALGEQNARLSASGGRLCPQSCGQCPWPERE